jgi:hypothetical protein
MGQWLNRLDLTEKQFLATGAYIDLGDYIARNPTWPLRAFIGLACEVAEEVANVA